MQAPAAMRRRRRRISVSSRCGWRGPQRGSCVWVPDGAPPQVKKERRLRPCGAEGDASPSVRAGGGAPAQVKKDQKDTQEKAAKSGKARLDLMLVGRGLAVSRERAQALILAGQVTVDGSVVTKAGTMISS